MQMLGVLSSAISTFRRWASSIQVESFDIMEVVSVNWHLGFTAFGGPPVHFQIVRNHNLKAFSLPVNRLTPHSSIRSLWRSINGSMNNW